MEVVQVGLSLHSFRPLQMSARVTATSLRVRNVIASLTGTPARPMDSSRTGHAPAARSESREGPRESARYGHRGERVGGTASRPVDASAGL